MSTSSKIINFIFNTNYWKERKEYNKVRDVLKEFFASEQEPLQKSFINNFDYPEDMTDSPVRFETKSGDIYYTLNFKSKELFENSGTQEKALSNSLAVLDKYLPLGVVNYLEPQPPIHIPDTFTLLCSLTIQSEVTPRKTTLNLLGTIGKSLGVLVILGTILGTCIKYLLL